MTHRVLSAIAFAVVGVLLACSALATALLLDGGAAGCATPPKATTGAWSPSATMPNPGGVGPIGQWNAEQVTNAAIIVTVGAGLGVPPRGWVIATATAMQESSLINLPGGHLDSVGLFQQRPSQGWGSPAELHDPATAAGKFYRALLDVDGWQTMALTKAAQRVQHSATPDAYATWEPAATMLVARVGSANWRTIPENLEKCLNNCPQILSKTPADLRNPSNAAFVPDSPSDTSTPKVLKISEQRAVQITRNGQGSTLRTAHDLPEPTARLTGIAGAGLSGCAALISAQGWTQPVHAPIVSGFRSAERPDHDGVDLSVAKGTPIVAASAGTVAVVRCNAIAADGSEYGCDRDGSTAVRGCGWYVDIDHPGGLVTRYCHQLVHPAVAEGQHVDAGQNIGLSGTSGNSCGPHLHFEVHTGGDHGSSGAVDAAVFMASVGAPLSA